LLVGDGVANTHPAPEIANISGNPSAPIGALGDGHRVIRGEPVIPGEDAHRVLKGRTGVQPFGHPDPGRESAQAISIEDACLLFEVKRDAFLVTKRASRAVFEDSHGLSATIGGGRQMAQHLVHGEAQHFPGTELPVRDEDDLLSGRRPGREPRLDPDRHLETSVARYPLEELAEGRLPGQAGRGQRARLGLASDLIEDAAREGCDRGRAFPEGDLFTTVPEASRSEGSNPPRVTESFEHAEVELELFEAGQVELPRRDALGELPRGVEEPVDVRGDFARR